jgi:hypothetical protein
VVWLVLVLGEDEADELPDGAVTLDRVAEWKIPANLVKISTAFLGDSEITPGCQVVDDSLDRALGDPD